MAHKTGNKKDKLHLWDHTHADAGNAAEAEGRVESRDEAGAGH